MPKKEPTPSMSILALKSFIRLALFSAFIFVLAGRLDYWQGWFYTASNFVLLALMPLIFKGKEGLIKERTKPGPGMKGFDKVFYIFFIPLAFAIFIVGVLDSGRFMWTPEQPIYMYFLSYAVYFLAMSYLLWAMLENYWFSSVVRIQKDREQKVVSSGPYAHIRHPGYAGGIIMFFAYAGIFGSVWALIPAALCIPLFIIRTYLEDKTLQKELPGYKDYTKKVKFRLIPGIW